MRVKWRDAHTQRLRAGLAYQDDIDSLRLSALQNPIGVVHALDVTIAALLGLRDDIEGGNDEGIALRLKSALMGRERWLNERMAAEWTNPMRTEMPDTPSIPQRLFGGMFFGRKPRKK